MRLSSPSGALRSLVLCCVCLGTGVCWVAQLAAAPGSRAAVSPRCASARLDEEAEGLADLNYLQTRLHLALEQEDYAAAAAMRDQIQAAAGAAGSTSWGSLGLPDWLADRLTRLDYPLPTRVQMHALTALERGDDAAVCAPTGSGKTLAYLLPVLAQLSDDLLSEDLSGYLASFLDGGRRKGSEKGLARRKAVAGSVEDGSSSLEAMSVPTPAVLIVVPTRELGVQVSMLCYRLLGGGRTNPTLQPYNHPSRYQPGGKANMFSFAGPRHVKVAGLWDEQSLYATAEQDLLKGVHVVVGTPEFLSRAGLGENLRLQNVRGLVIDEADACLSGELEAGKAMSLLLRRMNEARTAAGVRTSPQTVLAGASLSPALVRRALDVGWVRAPTLVSEYGCIERGCELETLAADGEARPGALVAGGGASAWTEQRVPAGHAHEYVVVEPREGVAVLCRMLREQFEGAADAGESPPRVVVFAPSAIAAVALAEQLQGALFGTLTGESAAGLWGLSVLLPSAEGLEERVDEEDDTLSVLESSLRVMEMFAVNRTSVLVTTAAATRGLDFPQVTHVLNLGIVGSAADYVHRAGRVGRVGQLAKGTVTSVLCAAEVPDLVALGRELHFDPVEVSPPEAATLSEELSMEERVQALTDSFYLYGGEQSTDGPKSS